MQEAEHAVQDRTFHCGASEPRIAGISDQALKTKQDWTLELMQEAADTQPLFAELSKCYIFFWYNPNETRGFRLTTRAADLLIDKGYESWSYIIQKEMVNTGRILLLLDEKMTTPWQLHRNKLTVFDPQMAFAMNLTQQDLIQAINLIY